MYARQPVPEVICTLAHRQAGVISRAQLVGAGLSDAQVARLVRGDVLVHFDRAIYLLGAREMSWCRFAWAAVLLGGRGTRLMGRSAGAIEGLCAESLPVCLGVPPGHRLRSRSWLRVVRETPGARSPAQVGGPARTLVEDTVLDLCADAESEAEVIGFVTTAAQRLTTQRRLAAAMARRSRMAHRRLVSELLAEVAVGVGSPLELRWLRDVERPHGLPRPIRPFLLPSGEWADGAYPELKILLELDGRAYHHGERRFRDWRRDNRGSEDGWLTLRYGWHDAVVDACAAAGNLARVARLRGWTGRPRRCERCVGLTW